MTKLIEAKELSSPQALIREFLRSGRRIEKTAELSFGNPGR